MLFSETLPSHEAGAAAGWIGHLADRFRSRRARVAVIGLGYAGLPMALALAEAGFATIGIDADRARLARLAAGETGLRHVPDPTLRAAQRAGRFEATGDWSRLVEVDAILICVPTPLGPDGTPDLAAVRAASRSVAWHLHPGQLVVLESTTWPGTTREVVRPILEATGLRCGVDFFLAYSPEREDPGNARFRTAGIPRVVGGADAAALHLAEALYGAAVERTVPVASLEAAEAVKLAENAFRAVNIALANELKLAFGAMGIDVWEVVGAAASKPFGYMPFWPGPGVGGHCIPVDPVYLTWRARESGAQARLLELAGAINAAMPAHVVDVLEGALRCRGRRLAGSRILLLGAAYKPDIEDVRESPALALMALIEARGAEAPYHDPHVAELPPMPGHPGLAGRRSLPWAEALAGCDAAVIVTDHDGLDYAGLCAAAPLVLDTRNACARRGLAGPNIVAA
ncbi:nucleotide sugar dehydrogenase [Paracraurococcus lichenis]|uniref:Nucleotide sugar dehydrogenase n=1 Tax=Paracraurococcus lichenis TaxID=3064888 RepID=A0ABT9E600_9PROT|nr:nucleotide sugar dehydrogenase [Paracraurococcus sp. LOR1-02]MDO9711420.1 nucleotide sugar dehydrogenase [Paracraurococcus sp. LOR1-02]